MLQVDPEENITAHGHHQEVVTRSQVRDGVRGVEVNTLLVEDGRVILETSIDVSGIDGWRERLLACGGSGGVAGSLLVLVQY